MVPVAVVCFRRLWVVARACVAPLLFVLLASVADAQTIQVTSGYLDITGTSGPIVLGGDRGFSMDTRVSTFGGVFGPDACNSDPIHCTPGATISLFAYWSGLDLSLTNRPVTVDGNSYWDVNCGCPSPNFLNVQFSGSATLPPIAPSATVTAPFVFTGPFGHQAPGDQTPTGETMVGTGAATLYLTADPFFPGSWHLNRVLYVFGSALPFPWRSADVGFVGQPGSASDSAGTFTIAGAGRDIWGTADSFNFTSQLLPGDGEIVARVTSEQNTNPFAKAGVMMRQNYDQSAAFVLVDVKPDGGIELLSRATAGGDTAYLGGTTVTFPASLKLTRAGATITASASSDGVTWTVIGSTALTGNVYAGLAVTSHDSNTTNTAIFDQVYFTPAGSLPTPWSHLDVGQVGVPGFASYASGTFTIGGAGADIWGTDDAFHFTYQLLNGDTQITARVVSAQNTNTFAKAGVMIRENLASNVANVVLDIRPGGEIEFMSRSTAGASTTFLGGATTSYPVWLRLTRSGTTVTGAISSDGSTWTTVGSTALSISTGAYVGMVVTSHDTGVLDTATFDTVTVGAASAGGSPGGNVVVYAADVPAANVHGAWSLVPDATAAAGSALATPDTGASNAAAALAAPVDYVDVPFTATAGTPYTLWLRLEALGDSKYNDSIWVQFSDAMASGSAAYAIGSAEGLLVNLATDATASSLQQWGWQNTAYWLTQATTVTFASSGPHTIRIQTREDGVRFDQVVLSPSTYLNVPPGPVSGDTTIVAKP